MALTHSNTNCLAWLSLCSIKDLQVLFWSRPSWSLKISWLENTFIKKYEMRVFFDCFVDLIVKSQSRIHKFLLSMFDFSWDVLDLNFFSFESSIFHYLEHYSFRDSSVWESSMKQLASHTNACGCPKMLVSLTYDKLKFFQL